MRISMKIWWKFSKASAKELRENWQILKTNKSYMNEILKTNEIFEIKENGAKMRNKCDWHEYGEKSSKFF